MASYVQDPNDSKKQVPASLPDNAYDRAKSVGFFKYVKTPNSVFFGDVTGDIGFFFGSSASFANLDLTLSGTGQITASNNSTHIEGTWTSFTTELAVGDKIKITSASVSQVLIVDSILNNVSMSLTANWTGNTYSQSAVERKRSFMSENYIDYGSVADGTELLINPTAVSGSSVDDNNSVIFMYRSGLSGPPKRF